MSSRPLPESLLQRTDLWVGSRLAAVAAESTGHAALDRLLPGGGWPLGALSEVLVPRPGVGEMQLILPLLARLSQAGRRVAFVAPPLIPYAPALLAAGVDLDLCWVAEPASAVDCVWAIEQMLRCPGIGAVAGWLASADERVQRRLQLAAEDNGSGGGAIGLLIRPPQARRQPSVAALRLAITASADGPIVEVLKARGGRVGQTARLAA
ncbi:MAG: CDP-6-deoxy-delta-3,4-glucoseen reductase [Hydrocarboniphaga sp.]|uniref:translesion DNA synthesis-associated protein ImuA n=1 Tax=Hydrocarboniphaga sp. TaxID=2033016 RepID=UPI00262C1369|nr:translesion DNA synthesis-associated protein ImuA [Hydrocarboniphaga sp.]MDB5968110.1 CDP-6-deoxy-delta-3,4-glucoseen reductase [Hydrocarboniphaga sp.]